MSSSDFVVTYMSISPDDVSFWGIRFFGMEQPDSLEAAPQSPIQTPLVPHDEDEREPMFIQPHDLDYVPEPMYPEYIPLEDEHVFLAEEQPLPPVISPTAESPEDDTDDEDEEDEEMEEHLASADSTVVVPTIDPVSPPEGTEPVISPPSTDIATTEARITVRLQASISLSPEAEVHDPICTFIATTCTITITDAVTAALLSPPLPPPLYIPPPVDRRDDVPETEMPPRKRSCLFALGFSTLDVEARRRGFREVRYGIRDTWVDLAEAVPEIEPMTLREVNTRVTELAELHEHDTQDLYALLEDDQDSRTRISQRVTTDSQRLDLLMEDRIAHQETILIREEETYATREAWAHSIGLSQAVHFELQTHRE
uniref:Uncharacterized protein n=1 Tax=Tanacetum cinerariifolium TaxID=118510 RepID=A0A699L901_TANCI|nr:hypothetical protein [Tanacetum cinerariifolium]